MQIEGMRDPHMIGLDQSVQQYSPPVRDRQSHIWAVGGRLRQRQRVS